MLIMYKSLVREIRECPVSPCSLVMRVTKESMSLNASRYIAQVSSTCACASRASSLPPDSCEEKRITVVYCQSLYRTESVANVFRKERLGLSGP